MGNPSPTSQPTGGSQSQSERNSHISHNQVVAHNQPHGRLENNGSSVPDRSDRGIHNSDSLVGVGGDVRNAFGSSNINMGNFFANNTFNLVTFTF